MTAGSRGGRVNWGVLGLGLTLVAGLVGIMATGFGNDPRAVPNVLEGKPAPSFTLADLDGRTWTLDELRGRPIVLNFWSTWCGPCKQEHPVLLDGAARYDDVVFLGVIYADSVEASRRYLARAGSAYAHLIDPDGAVAVDYGVAGVPETYFIGADGVIAHKQVGPVSPGLLAGLVGRLREGM